VRKKKGNASSLGTGGNLSGQNVGMLPGRRWGKFVNLDNWRIDSGIRKKGGELQRKGKKRKETLGGKGTNQERSISRESLRGKQESFRFGLLAKLGAKKKNRREELVSKKKSSTETTKSKNAREGKGKASIGLERAQRKKKRPIQTDKRQRGSVRGNPEKRIGRGDVRRSTALGKAPSFRRSLQKLWEKAKKGSSAHMRKKSIRKAKGKEGKYFRRGWGGGEGHRLTNYWFALIQSG